MCVCVCVCVEMYLTTQQSISVKTACGPHHLILLNEAIYLVKDQSFQLFALSTMTNPASITLNHGHLPGGCPFSALAIS